MGKFIGLLKKVLDNSRFKFKNVHEVSSQESFDLLSFKSQLILTDWLEKESLKREFLECYLFSGMNPAQEKGCFYEELRKFSFVSKDEDRYFLTHRAYSLEN